MVLTLLAIVLLVFGLFYLGAGFKALKRVEPVTSVAHITISVAFFAISFCFILGFVTLKGYKAFTQEALAARVHIEPIEEGQFYAHFQFPDGKKHTYKIFGEALYVDAHILKWNSLATFMGIQTSYQLARVGGRYQTVMDEINKKRTIFPIGEENKQDLFELRKKFSSLTFLVDAEYGSASFVTAKEGHYTLMVSTSGLLFREMVAP